MTHYIPVGTSEPQDFAITNDGAVFDGTGFDVTLEIYREVIGRSPQALGSPVATVEWLDAEAGTVRVTGCGDLLVGDYLVRFKVTDGSNHDGFFPNGALADLWRVVPVPAR